MKHVTEHSVLPFRYALLSLVFMLAGCATSPDLPAHAEAPMPSGPEECTLQPGDRVNITFLYWPEFNADQIIRPDGKITLALVNDVDAAGLRPIELRERLLGLYESKLKRPEITVVAEMQENRRVFVGGEVNIFRNTDGLVQIPLVGRMTALMAVMQAGGFRNESAQLRNVVIVRRIGDTQYARTIDMRTTFKNGESDPFYLQPDDIVFVPRTKIDRVDQWVDQFMNQPVPRWLTATVDVNNIVNDNEAPRPSREVTYTNRGVQVSVPR